MSLHKQAGFIIVHFCMFASMLLSKKVVTGSKNRTSFMAVFGYWQILEKQGDGFPSHFAVSWKTFSKYLLVNYSFPLKEMPIQDLPR